MSEQFRKELSEEVLEKVVGGAQEGEENRCTLKVGGYLKTGEWFHLTPNPGSFVGATVYEKPVVCEVREIAIPSSRWAKITVPGAKTGWIHEGEIAEVADYEFMLNPNIPAG